jgi:toxin ParE1/3/4
MIPDRTCRQRRSLPGFAAGGMAKTDRMALTVRFRPAADADLNALYTFIASRSGRERAHSYLGRIEAACMGLALFPERGSRRDDLEPGVRLIGFEHRVTIAFRIEGEVVRIVRVFYGGRDFEAGNFEVDQEDE